MSLQKFSILIVDDTPENIDILRNLLADEYQVKVAINGQKALQIVAAGDPPDLILLDVMMPEMDGYAVCKALKTSREFSAIPIIFITCKTDIEDEKVGLSLGACDYIAKPFDPEIVQSRIKTHLQMSVQKLQLQQQLNELKSQTKSWQKDIPEVVLSQMVAAGENDNVEFKSTLRWHLFAKRNDVKIENQCLKSIAAFLNSEGGSLFVGVDDDGVALGLESDQFKNEDKLLLHWHNLLREYLGADMAHTIRSTVCELQSKRILLVQCGPSSRPVFMRRDNEEYFYVRMGNTSQALKPSEMLAYVDHRYGNAR
jgi:putative two-component system response regulator